MIECPKCHHYIHELGWGSHRDSYVCYEATGVYDSGYKAGLIVGRRNLKNKVLDAMNVSET